MVKGAVQSANHVAAQHAARQHDINVTRYETISRIAGNLTECAIRCADKAEPFKQPLGGLSADEVGNIVGLSILLWDNCAANIDARRKAANTRNGVAQA